MTIKKLREKYNLTQSALARSLGVSSNAISGIEAGRIKLSPKMSAKIKDVYGEKLPSAETEKPAEAAATTPEKKTTTKKTRSEKKAAPEKAAEVTAPAPEKKTILEKATETETASTAPEKMVAPKKAAQEKKATPGKNVAPKKVEETITATASAPAKKAEKKAEPKKPVREKNAPATPTVILQSPFGGEITVDMITSRVGEVDKVYVRIDQNKLYWVKGEETGAIDIW